MNVKTVTAPDIVPAEPTASVRPSPGSLRSDLALAFAVVACFAGIFVFDLLTPTDNVSVCFLYVIPMFLALAGKRQPVWIYATIATLLSVLGSFFQPPDERVSMAVFYANRGIAVVTMWLAAAMITARRRADLLIRSSLEQEREKAESRGRFLDMISHEIGTSLTTIDGQAYRLTKLASSPSPDNIVTRAGKIHSAVLHIKTIVQRIQFASEAGERALQPQFDTIDLRAIAAECVQEFRYEYANRVFETDFAAFPDRIRGDRYMLKEIVENLLSNAIKYSPMDTTIRVTGQTDGGEAVLSVIDFGRGIADAELEKLFTPYYRARNSRGVHGAGIGLYVCDRFVESHGGKIRIESGIGLGTTVIVRLPITGEAQQDAAIENPMH